MRAVHGTHAAVLAEVLVAVLVLLSGCAMLPDSGAAGPGRDVGESAVEPLRVVPQGPRPGADPADLVRGFLGAGAGFDDDHAVARTFLSRGARTTWTPSRGVIVYPDDAALTVTVQGSSSPVQVDVRAPVTATIDSEGRYRQASPGSQAHAVFTLTQIAGQWRVSVMDQSFGLWLPKYQLDRAFSPLRVYFVAVGSRVLVPELRWLPGPRQALATALVRLLVAGPPTYLKDAVTTGMPVGTRLAVDAVPTTDGIAQVDLTTTALQATPEQRLALWWQLTTTLRQLPSVSGVQVTVAGAVYSIPGISGAMSATDQGFRDDVRVTGSPIVLSDNRLLRVDQDTGSLDVKATGSSSGLPPGAGLRSISAAPKASFIVGVASNGRQVVRLGAAGAHPSVLVSGTALLNPVVDTWGWTWTADTKVPGRLIAVAPTAGLTAEQARGILDVAWLAGRTVVALDVARDGTRLAVISTGEDGYRIDVSGIVREVGSPTRLADHLVVGRALRSPTALAWGDRTNLVVIAQGGKGRATPYELVVGGSSTALAEVAGVVGVAVGDGLRAVYLTTSDGKVLVRSGSGWRTVGRGRSITIPE